MLFVGSIPFVSKVFYMENTVITMERFLFFQQIY